MSSSSDKRQAPPSKAAASSATDVAVSANASSPAGRPTGKAPARSRARPADGDRDMGLALRSVYQRTVEETVPDEMLDLLGKLG